MGIIQLYKKDIAKYDPNENLNEHFKFSIYEHSFIWLKEAGVALPVFCAQEPRIPLLLSKATNMFKLFCLMWDAEKAEITGRLYLPDGSEHPAG